MSHLDIEEPGKEAEAEYNIFEHEKDRDIHMHNHHRHHQLNWAQWTEMGESESNPQTVVVAGLGFGSEAVLERVEAVVERVEAVLERIEDVPERVEDAPERVEDAPERVEAG